MLFLKHWWLGHFLACTSLRWMPCHEFLMPLCPPPSFPSLLFDEGEEAMVFGDGDGWKGGWVSVLRWWWWPDVDALKLFLALLMILTMIAEIRFIASSSMFPTLRAGDRVIAEKISFYFRSPSIDDIVLFRACKTLQDFGFKKDDVFIKRIVAKAGDFVEVYHGLLFVNGIAQREDFIAEQPNYRTRPTVCPYFLPLILSSRILFLDAPAENVLEQH